MYYLFLVSIVLNFLSYSTAVYHPDFHDRLHSGHIDEVDHHDELGVHSRCNSHQDEHHSDSDCQSCKALNHIATNVATPVKLRIDSHFFWDSIDSFNRDIHLPVVSSIFSGRAPPR